MDDQHKFEALFGTPAVGVAVVSADGGRLVDVNEQLAHLLGYSREELRRYTQSDLCHPADSGTVGDELEGARAGRPGQWTRRLLHRAGHVLWVDVFSQSIRDVGAKEGDPCSQYLVVVRPQPTVAILNGGSRRRASEDDIVVPRQSLLWLQKNWKVIGGGLVAAATLVYQFWQQTEALREENRRSVQEVQRLREELDRSRSSARSPSDTGSGPGP